MPRKTFHFEPDFDEVHLVLFGAYMRISALCEVLRGIVEETGEPAPWAYAMLKDTDLLVSKAIRVSDPG